LMEGGRGGGREIDQKKKLADESRADAVQRCLLAIGCAAGTGCGGKHWGPCAGARLLCGIWDLTNRSVAFVYFPASEGDEKASPTCARPQRLPSQQPATCNMRPCSQPCNHPRHAAECPSAPVAHDTPTSFLQDAVIRNPTSRIYRRQVLASWVQLSGCTGPKSVRLLICRGTRKGAACWPGTGAAKGRDDATERCCACHLLSLHNPTPPRGPAMGGTGRTTQQMWATLF
jgi:hypothetical protein